MMRTWACGLVPCAGSYFFGAVADSAVVVALMRGKAVILDDYASATALKLIIF